MVTERMFFTDAAEQIHPHAWRAYSADTTEAEARAAFRTRYGCEPAAGRPVARQRARGTRCRRRRRRDMKILVTIVLGLVGLAIVIGGLGSAAEDTFPQAVPVTVAGNNAAAAGDPTLLIILVVVVVIGFVLGNRGN